MNTCVVIVTYNPDEKLLSTVKSLTKQNVEILIVDNTVKEKNEILQLVSTDYPTTHIKRNNENIGLASAQNIGIEYAIQNCFEYTSFFDQDSIVPENYFSIIQSDINSIELKENNNFGAIGPDFLDRNTKQHARYAKLKKISFETVFFNNEKEILNVSFLISSGSVFQTKVFKKIGIFREDFFIDQVDTEFSLRLLSNGYNLYATNSVILNHTIGDRSLEKIMGLTIKPNHHNSKRKFFIFRNGMKTILMYGKKYPSFINLMTQRFIHDILGVIFFESKKFEKMKFILLGIIEGLKPPEKWKMVDANVEKK